MLNSILFIILGAGLSACVAIFIFESAAQKQAVLSASEIDQNALQELRIRTEVPISRSLGSQLLSIEKDRRLLFFTMPEDLTPDDFSQQSKIVDPVAEEHKQQRRLEFLRWLVSVGKLTEYPIDA